MAKEIGVVYVPVVPSGKGFGKAVEGQITDAADSGSKKGSSSILSKIGGAFSTVGKVGVGAIGAVATGIVGLAAKGGFSRALNIENAQAKLKGLGHDSASVTEIMNDALASVKGTAFGLGDAATVAASLSASGVQQGGQLTKVLKTVADTAQISGRSLTDIGTIFGSVAARGKLQGDDMLQLMSSGVPVLQMLGKHLGKTSSEVSTMVSKGKIDFQTFADAMQEGMGGAALSAGATFTGAWNNVKAALSRLGEQLATPILNGLRGLFNQAIPLIDGFTATATPIMESVGAALQSGLEKVIPSLNSFFSWLTQAFTGLVALLGRGDFTNAFRTAFKVEEDSPVVDFLLKTRDAIGNLIGSIVGLFANLSGLATQLTPLVLAFASVGAAAGSQLPAVINLCSGIISAVSGVVGFIGSNADWLVPLATGIAGVVLASKGLGAVTSGLTNLAKGAGAASKGIKDVTAWFELAHEVGGIGPMLKESAAGLKIVSAATATWSAVTKLAIAVQTMFKAVWAASPWGVVIAGITAVVAALVWFFTKTKMGQKIWAGFMSWLTSAWQNVSGFFKTLWAGIVGVFNGAASGVKNAWNGVTGFFQGIATGITNVWNGVTGFFKNLWAGITGIFQTAVNWIGSFLQSGWGQAILMMINPIAGLVNFIVQHFDTIKTVITNVLIVVAAIWVTIWNSVVSFFTSIWNGLVAFFTPIITGIQNVITTVVTEIQATWNTVWGAISGFFTALWNGMIAFVTPIIQTIGSVIGSVIAGVQSTWNSVWSAVSGFFTSVWNGMVGFVAPIINTISAVISGVINGIRNTWNSTWSAISGFFSGIWNGMVNAVSGFVGRIAGVIGGIKNTIMGALSGAGSWLFDVGKNIIQGLINGIGGAFTWLKDKITELGNNVLNWAKGVLGIHSPSRVFRSQVGYMVGAGMALGIDDSMKTVRNSVRQMGSLTDEFGFDATPGRSAFAPTNALSVGGKQITVNYNAYADPALGAEQEFTQGMQRAKAIIDDQVI
ncbi:MAG: tape measure protein [Bifidobacterium crudilactis]|jgi:tape measure domain-containing protein